MRVANLTLNLLDSEIKPLIDFAAGFCKYADRADIVIQRAVQDDAQGRPTWGGEARGLTRGISTYLVTVGQDARAAYPRLQQMSKLTPVVNLTCWEDEFLVVIAHELRHIDQFAVGSHSRHQELEAEVDAETFAAAVLKAYREHRA